MKKPGGWLIALCLLTGILNVVKEISCGSVADVKYCFREGERQSLRNIPELSEDSKGMKPKLKHVQTLIRHGARLPLNFSPCPTKLTGLNTEVSQLVGLMRNGELVAAPSSLKHDVNPLVNPYAGTSMPEHLTAAAVDQLKIVAKALEPYLTKLDINNDNFMSMIYARPTDLERTKMSTDVVLWNLFATTCTAPSDEQCVQQFREMVLHTVPYDKEYICPNDHVFPHLNMLKRKAQNSYDYQTNIRSHFHSLTDDFGKELTSNFSFPDHYDCFISLFCDECPKYKEVGSVLVNRASDVFYKGQFFEMSYYNAAYGKLAATYLVRDMYLYTLPFLTSTHGPPKEKHHLVVFGIHDLSIMMLLAALGVENIDIVPYASLLTFEVYEAATKEKVQTYFRIVLNAKVITEKVKGCQMELCPIDIFNALAKELNPGLAHSHNPEDGSAEHGGRIAQSSQEPMVPDFD